MPVPWRKTASGTIPVDAPLDDKPMAVALYARATTSGRISDRQLARLSHDAAEHDLHVVAAMSEVGSGLNGRRRKRLRLLSDATYRTRAVSLFSSDATIQLGCSSDSSLSASPYSGSTTLATLVLSIWLRRTGADRPAFIGYLDDSA